MGKKKDLNKRVRRTQKQIKDDDAKAALALKKNTRPIAMPEKAEAAAEAAAAGSIGERDGRTRPSSSISEKESQTAGAAATAAACSYRLELQVPTRWLCKL